MTLAYIGLGSNLGPRKAKIQEALEALRGASGLSLLRHSPIYETAPVGGPPQGDYLNAVAEVRVEVPARELLTLLLEVEARLGRVRMERWGSRAIDLDLLLYGTEVRVETDLVIPHPRLREREFVLRPLADLAREMPIPPDGRRVGDLLEEISTLPGGERCPPR